MINKIRKIFPSFESVLVFLYFFSLYLPSITKYKSLILILILFFCVKKIAFLKINFVKAYSKEIGIPFLFLIASVFYGLVISPNFEMSWYSISKPVLVDGVLVFLLLPILFFGNDCEKKIKNCFYGLISSLILLLLIDVINYYQEFQKNISLINDFSHRYLSDMLLLLSPFILVFLNDNKKKNFVFGIVLAVLASISMIGTMARAAWLAMLLVGLVWVVTGRQYKLLIFFAGFAAASFLLIKEEFPHSLLSEKMVQTDSSYRYGNGTQGSAIDLIMENPILGYGYGNDIYHQVYNESVKRYPDWFFKESIGPHNTFLAMWFGSGLFGLIAFIVFVLSFLWTSARLYISEQERFFKAFTLALALAFLGAFVIRGMFEAGQMNAFGWMTALLTVLVVRSKKIISESAV